MRYLIFILIIFSFSAQARWGGYYPLYHSGQCVKAPETYGSVYFIEKIEYDEFKNAWFYRMFDWESSEYKREHIYTTDLDTHFKKVFCGKYLKDNYKEKNDFKKL